MGKSLSFGLLILVSVASAHLLAQVRDGGKVPNEAPVAEVKVALLGDTGAGPMFGSVLGLVVAERADIVMINGDLGYGSAPVVWKERLLSAIDVEAFAVIGSLGNHDVENNNASAYVTAFADFRNDRNGLKRKCTGTTGITQGRDIVAVDEVCTFGNLSIVVSGIGQVLSVPYLEEKFEDKLKSVPAGNWKLAGYHYTLTSMNPGIKSNQNTFKFFDLIRQHGAIGAQAHTHTVMASCPISSAFALDAAVLCHPEFGSDLENRFVAPGTGLFVDSSLSGREARVRGRCKNPTDSSCAHMVDIISKEGYTRADGVKKAGFNTFGAMFIVFNVGGDPTKAQAYFKSVDGQVVFKFNITR